MARQLLILQRIKKLHYLVLILVSIALVGIRTGEYLLGHFTGNRDGAITTPFLVVTLPILYSVLLTMLTLIIIAWLSARLHLQKSITPVILFALLLTIGWVYQYHVDRTLYLSVSMQSSVSGVAQVFYDLGYGFNESDSVILDITEEETFTTLRFPLSPHPIYALRFDLLDKAGQVRVQDIGIVTKDGHVVQKIGLQALQPISHITRIAMEHDLLLVETDAYDPQALLTVPSPLISNIDRHAIIFYGFGVFGGMIILLSGICLLLRRHSFVQRNLPRMTRIVTQTAGMIAISLIVGELTIRIYNYFNPVFIFYTNSYNRFRGKPFEEDYDFTLNSQGFKDLEFTAKQPDRYRVIGIGDSFAFGVVPYTYNYLTLIESQFIQQGFDVEILNMGIPGIGPREYLSVFVREGLNLTPDMVLLSLFIGNDFIDGENHSEKRPLYAYSYLASLIRYLIHIQPQSTGGFAHGKQAYCDTCPSFEQAAFLELERRTCVNYIKAERSHFIRLFDQALTTLIQIRDICQKKGIALIVVIIPDELQINPALQTEVQRTFYPHVPAEAWDFTFPNDLLTSKLKALNINYLDLYPYFASASQQQSLYKLRDTHWNIAGNQFAAEVIYAYLSQYINQKTR